MTAIRVVEMGLTGKESDLEESGQPFLFFWMQQGKM